MNTAREKGKLAEYYVQRLLARKGYGYIIKSNASRTPIDLIASNGTEIVAVQCKQGGYISREGKDHLIEWAAKFNAKPCLARKQRGRWAIVAIQPSLYA
jgi:Holliday junction resolvase